MASAKPVISEASVTVVDSHNAAVMLELRFRATRGETTYRLRMKIDKGADVFEIASRLEDFAYKINRWAWDAIKTKEAQDARHRS